jgi:hypothetical protein
MANTIRSFILLIVSCLSLNFATAQHTNSFAGVRFGAVLPMGEFASHEFGYGGYALLGRSFGAEAAWFINPKIGFGIDISSNTFAFASGYYADDYMESEHGAFSSVDLLSSKYILRTYMAGAYYKIPISKKFSTSLKLMGGIFKASTPDQFFGVNAMTAGKLYFWKTSSTSTKFTFLTGASIEYRVYEQVSLILQADFTYAQAAFPYTTGTTSYTDYLKMPVFRLQPGINIHF